MSDLIRREDAIKALAQDLMYESCVQSEYASDELSDWIEVAKVILEKVPPADRPQGEWEKIGEDTYYHRCPYCKRIRAFKDSKFCDWCGARMKGADDE